VSVSRIEEMLQGSIIKRMRLASPVYRLLFLLALVLTVALSSSSAGAQTSPDTEQLAADTAELVTKANVQRVLTAPLQG
jgi:hypothetical protein